MVIPRLQGATAGIRLTITTSVPSIIETIAEPTTSVQMLCTLDRVLTTATPDQHFLLGRETNVGRLSFQLLCSEAS